jgi:hypothetical protein
MTDSVSDEDLARARKDPAFRQAFLARHLDRLLEALKRVRRQTPDAQTAGQIREGAELAVKLADRLQSGGDQAA